MNADQFIGIRVPAATKAAFGAMARQQGMTDSALLRRMIEQSLRSAGAVGDTGVIAGERPAGPVYRLSVRLRVEDQLLLRERAAARGVAPATYVSVLTRSHLRSLAPLPKEELLALRRSIAELGAIGRNLNQIARAANQGGRPDGLGQQEVRIMLRVCEGLRDHVKALLHANLKAWGQGHADPGEILSTKETQ